MADSPLDVQGKVSIETGGAQAAVEALATKYEKLANLVDGAVKGALVGFATQALSGAVGKIEEFLAAGDRFGDVADGMGGSIKRAQDAVDGLVPAMDLMTTRAKLMSGDVRITEKDFENLSVAAKSTGERLGISTTEAMNQMAEAALKASAKGLRPLGISVEETGDKQRDFNVILDKYAEIAANGTGKAQGLADKIDKLKNAHEQANLELARSINDNRTLNEVFDKLFAKTGLVTNAMTDLRLGVQYFFDQVDYVAGKGSDPLSRALERQRDGVAKTRDNVDRLIATSKKLTDEDKVGLGVELARAKTLEQIEAIQRRVEDATSERKGPGRDPKKAAEEAKKAAELQRKITEETAKLSQDYAEREGKQRDAADEIAEKTREEKIKQQREDNERELKNAQYAWDTKARQRDDYFAEVDAQRARVRAATDADVQATAQYLADIFGGSAGGIQEFIGGRMKAKGIEKEADALGHLAEAAGFAIWGDFGQAGAALSAAAADQAAAAAYFAGAGVLGSGGGGRSASAGGSGGGGASRAGGGSVSPRAAGGPSQQQGYQGPQNVTVILKDTIVGNEAETAAKIQRLLTAGAQAGAVKTSQDARGNALMRLG